MNQSCDAIVNKRGMITIPKAVREKFGFKEGSRISFVVVDGVLEGIPYRTIEEMEAACKTTRDEMERIQEEDRELELHLENE